MQPVDDVATAVFHIKTTWQLRTSVCIAVPIEPNKKTTLCHRLQTKAYTADRPTNDVGLFYITYTYSCTKQP